MYYHQYSPVKQEHRVAQTSGNSSNTFNSIAGGDKNQCSNILSVFFCVAGITLLMTVLFLYIATVVMPSDESIMNSNLNNHSKAEYIKTNQQKREDNSKLYLPFGIAGGIAILIYVFIHYCFRDKI
jgi:uncharacterized membrane protein